MRETRGMGEREKYGDVRLVGREKWMRVQDSTTKSHNSE